MLTKDDVVFDQKNPLEHNQRGQQHSAEQPLNALLLHVAHPTANGFKGKLRSSWLQQQNVVYHLAARTLYASIICCCWSWTLWTPTLNHRFLTNMLNFPRMPESTFAPSYYAAIIISINLLTQFFASQRRDGRHQILRWSKTHDGQIIVKRVCKSLHFRKCQDSSFKKDCFYYRAVPCKSLV